MSDLAKAIPRRCSRPMATGINAVQLSFEEERKRHLASSVSPIVARFLQSMEYKPAQRLENSCLWATSVAKASSMGIPCPENSANWKRLKVGFNYAHYCYSSHPLEVQTYVAVYTLLAQCMDDHTPEAIKDIEKFFPRLCAGEQQPNTVLRGWAQMMREAHLHWSSVPANLIISSSLHFINSTIIEYKRLVCMDTQTRSGKSWAYYLRNMDGLGDAFAAFTFPSALYPDVSQFIQAVPDMAMFIVHANDIISFYKEELSGETDNYVHSRARYDKKDVLATLKDIAEETEACYRRIREILGGNDNQTYATAWLTHEQGYIDFHKFSERYRLKDLHLKKILYNNL